MKRKVRLISSNGVEIGVPGIESPFLDSLLTDHPHKVATISIPFSDKAILDLARNVANPDCELSRSVAKKIAAIYIQLGIVIEVEENVVNNIETTNTEDDTHNNAKMVTAQVEPKYIIKIEIEPVASRAVVELGPSSLDIDNVSTTVHLQAMVQAVIAQTTETDEIMTDLSNGPIQHDNFRQNLASQSVDFSYDNLGSIDSVEEHSSNQFADEEAVADNDIDQVTHNTRADSCDNILEADFSFHDLEEESRIFDLAGNSTRIVTHSMTRRNTSNDVGNVITNIIQTFHQSSTPGEVVTSLPSIVSTNQLLRLKFIKNGLFPIKDMAKKRKRKRGQH